MMAITTKSSISVKPIRFRRMGHLTKKRKRTEQNHGIVKLNSFASALTSTMCLDSVLNDAGIRSLVGAGISPPGSAGLLDFSGAEMKTRYLPGFIPFSFGIL